MENEIDQIESTENTDVQEPSSEAPANSDSGKDSDKELSSSPKEKPESQDNTPFHKHPRWIERDNELKAERAARTALEQKLSQLENRFSQIPQAKPAPTKEQTEFDSLVQDLEKVDPRLAAQIRSQAEAQKKVEELYSKIEQSEKQQAERERQATIQTAVSKINTLHESNKVDPALKQFINDKLDILHMTGKLNLQNLETEYKNVHDTFKKFIDDQRRLERESYVQAKKQDAGVPTSQPKGTPAKQAPKKMQWSKDPETARAQVVQETLKRMSANRKADAL